MKIDRINNIPLTEYSLVLTNNPNYPGIDINNAHERYHYFLRKLSAIEVLYKREDNKNFPLKIKQREG